MSDCILQTTVLSSRDNPDNEITLSLTDRFPNPPALHTLLRSAFEREVAENKLKIDYDYFSSDAYVHIILKGLMNWDGIPVSYICFIYDHDSHELQTIKALLFTFYGSNYMSNLKDIHKQKRHKEDYLHSSEDNEVQAGFFAQYSNATKQYIYDKVQNEVAIILYKRSPYKYIVDSSTVLPIETRARFTRVPVNLSCRNKSLQSTSTIHKASATEKSTTYILNGSSFAMGCAVESITLTENPDYSQNYVWTQIVVKLKKKYPQKEVQLLLADFMLKNKLPAKFDRFSNIIINKEIIRVTTSGNIVINPLVTQDN